MSIAIEARAAAFFESKESTMELKHTHLLLRIAGAVLAALIGASTVGLSGGALVEGRLDRMDAPQAPVPPRHG